MYEFPQNITILASTDLFSISATHSCMERRIFMINRIKRPAHKSTCLQEKNVYFQEASSVSAAFVCSHKHTGRRKCCLRFFLFFYLVAQCVFVPEFWILKIFQSVNS